MSVGQWADGVAAGYRFADRRTPLADVPETVDGAFYRQVPKIVDWIVAQLWAKLSVAPSLSKSGVNLHQGARENLSLILQNSIGNFPFSDVANAGGWRNVLKWMLERPIFTWDSEQPMVKIYAPVVDEIPVPFQKRDEDAYSASPALALAFLGYGPDATLSANPVSMPGRLQQAYYHPTYGIVFNSYFFRSVAGALSGMVDDLYNGRAFREDKTFLLLSDYQFGKSPLSPPQNYGFDMRVRICPYGPTTVDCQSAADFEQVWRVETWRAFPWITSAWNLPVNVYDALDDLAEKLRDGRRKEDLFEVLQMFASMIAFVGMGFAIQAIISTGFSLANSVNLIVKADALPGVDLGEGGKYLKLANGALDLESFSSNVGLDSLFSGSDTVDFSDFGDPYDFVGADATGSYFGDFYADDLPLGDVASWDLGDSWAGFEMSGGDLPDFDTNLDTLTGATGGSFFDDFDLSKFVVDLGKLYLTYNAQQNAAEQQGTRLPVATRPTVGTVRTLPDGSTATTNPDGSTTIRTTSGTVRTVMPSGQIVAGASSQWVPGVPNIAIIGGVGALAALLLLRK